MTDAPDPFVPPYVDLRSFAYMPLDVVRLRDSDIAVIVSADAFRAAVILWCAAWHQMPAASLPADDASLARLAGFGRDTTSWKVIAAEALRGFVLCSDGRLYHGVIAEKALTGWDAKQSQKSKTKAATAARKAKLQERQRDVDRDDALDVNQGDVREGSKKEDLLLSQDSLINAKPAEGLRAKSAKLRCHLFPPHAFAIWYSKYPCKKARSEAEKAFRKIEVADDTSFDTLIAGIDAFWPGNPEVKFWPYPAMWLKGRRWLDEPTRPIAASAQLDADGQPKIEFGGGVRWPETAVRSQIARWRSNPATWPEDRLGPPPDAPDCKVPDKLLRIAPLRS